MNWCLQATESPRRTPRPGALFLAALMLIAAPLAARAGVETATPAGTGPEAMPAAPARSGAMPLTAYQAQYEVLRNDRPVGSSDIRLQPEGTAWQFSSDTRGERGMASLVGFQARQQLRFDWHQGAIRPLHSVYDQKASLSSRRIEVHYDWAQGRYRLSDRRGEHSHALPAGTGDRHGSAVTIAAHLAAGERDFVFSVPYPDGLRQWRFKVTGEETVTVPAGSFQTLRVERIRQDSDRQTTSWHAPELDYLAVRTLQDEDGKRTESRLRSLDPPDPR
ncbi:MAG: DUF3108 domain-containing protein [Xanthomonadales bacterium]|nr:DUF3108 domain-containing protein [Xanthomonadales bacterium]